MIAEAVRPVACTLQDHYFGLQGIQRDRRRLSQFGAKLEFVMKLGSTSHCQVVAGIDIDKSVVAGGPPTACDFQATHVLRVPHTRSLAASTSEWRR